MRDTSWNAKGLVQPLWNRLDGKDKRGQLAKRTGIQATSLSQYNSGARPMTPEAAAKIAAAVPGTTPFDLGAPADSGTRPATVPTVLDHLEELRAMVVDADKERQNLRRRLDELEAISADADKERQNLRRRLDALEAARAPVVAPSTGQLE